jgi:membrane protein
MAPPGAKAVLSTVKEAFADWKEDNAPRLGAALAYYTAFSLAPLLVIAIAIAGLVFGHEAAQGRIVEEVQGLIGKAGAEAVQAMLEAARKPSSSVWAAILGTITLILGASGAFTELRGALNVVWEAPAKPSGGIWGAIRDRLLSFAMVMVLGFLLLVSLALSAGLAAVHGFTVGLWPGAKVLLEVVNAVFSFGVVTVLFAMIFKLLPDTKIAWRDVWAGAATTAALFTVGKTLIGLYLGKSSMASAYGAAASLAIILAWVYYAAQILFFGAELTQVYARRHGSRRESRGASAAPTEHAPRGPATPRPPSLVRPLPPGPPSPEPREAAHVLGRASRRAMAVYKAGVAVGVAAGRLLRRVRRDD